MSLKQKINDFFRSISSLNELGELGREFSSQAAAMNENMRSIVQLLHSIHAECWQMRAIVESMHISNALAADGRYADPKSLARFNRKMYSQQGEDGVVAEIFNRIGVRDQTFLEIGIGDGRENTTRFLLERGWRGTWVEGSPEQAAAAREFMKEYVDEGRLNVVQAFITAENIDEILDAANVPAEFDYLSLDIDHNTAHVWRALRRRSRAACVEYNCTLPPNTAISVPYDPEAVWDGTAWYGASLKTFENIGRAKGMALVGCDLVGVNSYFVSIEEAKGKFREPFDAETHYEPPRFYPFGVQHAPPSRPRPWIVE